MKHTPGLWFHKKRRISFTLVVDDFQIKYIDKKDVKRLLAAVKERYSVKVDWTMSKYVEMNLEYNYNKEQVILSMKRYGKKRNTKRAPIHTTFSDPVVNTWIKSIRNG